MSPKQQLNRRIDKTINTKGFERVLLAAGLDIIDLQMEWVKHDSFELLPKVYQDAILAGEAELI